MTRETEDRTLRPSASSRARLPGFRIPTRGDNADLERFLREVASWIQLREGANGNAQEAVVLQRDLNASGLTTRIVRQLTAAAQAPEGAPGAPIGNTLHPTGGSTASDLERLATLMFSSRAAQNFLKGTDDPTRFSEYSKEVQTILLRRIDEEAKARGAAIRRFETIYKTDSKSQAIAVMEVTAAAMNAMAGVRVTTFATAERGRATAGIVTQVSARLDNFDGSGSTVEEELSAVADAVDGFSAQWTIKVNTHGAYAGIGLFSQSPIAGAGTTKLIFVAQNVAFVTSTEVIGTGAGQINPTNPPANRIMFGIDSNGAYLGGNLKVSGKATIDGAFTTGGFSAAMHVNAGNAATNGIVSYRSGAGGGAINAFATGGGNGVNASCQSSGFGMLTSATGGGTAIRATGNFGGLPFEAINGVSGFQCQIATAAYSFFSDASQGKVYAVDGLGPFTGFHDALLPLPLMEGDYEPQVGDIMVDDELVQAKDVSNSLFTAIPCTQACQQGAIGIMNDVREIDDSLHLNYETWWNYQHTHMRLTVNGVGEGQINVCGRGGDLARGDLIACSDLTGKGQRQSDDVVRSYTVARARMAVVFSHPDEVKLVPCVYLCG